MKYNIPEETQLFAKQHGLSLIATDDGVSYVGTILPDGRQILLCDPEDAGLPGGELDQPAYIIQFSDEDWDSESAVVMRVISVREGIRFLSNFMDYDRLVRQLDSVEAPSPTHHQLMQAIVDFEENHGLIYSPYSAESNHYGRTA